jgi:hypothetical protein
MIKMINFITLWLASSIPALVITIPQRYFVLLGQYDSSFANPFWVKSNYVELTARFMILLKNL